MNDGTVRDLSKGFALFAVAFVAFTALMVTLSMIGLPAQLTSTLLATFTVLAFLIYAFTSRTMQLSDFQVASRSIPAGLNGMATAAAFLSSAGFLGLGGAFFAGNRAALAVIIGWTLGFLALAVLVAPYLRKAAAVSVADFLAIRFDSSAIRLAAFLVTLGCSAGLLVAEIAAAGAIATRLLPIDASTAVVIVVGVMIFVTVLGGMSAVTLTAIAQYIVLAVAFLTPVTILSLQQFDFPLPQVSYGFALKEIAALGDVPAVAAENVFLPLPSLDGFNMVALAISLAAGIAALPHVAARSTTTTSGGAARRSAGWAFFFVLLIAATAPAYGAFAQLFLVGTPAATELDPGFVVLDLPGIAAMVPAFSALIATGALAAVLAAAIALLFAMANTIGHDFYGGIIDSGGPPGRQLIVTRLALIMVAVAAGWYSIEATDRIFELATGAATLAASGLLPALVLGMWWKRTTAPGALAGIVLGFGAAAAYVFGVIYGDVGLWQPLGTGGTGLPPMAAAFLGLPVGILAIVIVSQITAEPTAEQLEALDNIRRPGSIQAADS